LKKEVLLELNGWDESWSSVEDYEIYFRIVKKGVKVALNPFVDCIVHKRANSMSRSTNPKKFILHVDHALKARAMIVEYMEANGLLTRELKKEYEIDLYFKMLRWKHKEPAFIGQRIKELKLNVPVGLKVKHELSAFKRKAKKKINKFF
jgi:hypothetical protein